MQVILINNLISSQTIYSSRFSKKKMIRQNMVWGVVISVGNLGVQVQSENWEYSGCVTVSLTTRLYQLLGGGWGS